jgi:NADH dehydrogenase
MKRNLKNSLRFEVIGGGATGVELAGALADMKKGILPKDYPELDFRKMENHLVDAAPRCWRPCLRNLH